MTEAEIIKAFNEYCHSVVNGYYDHISHGGKGDEHQEKHIDMICGIRDIINRQNVETERLRDLNNVLETDVVNANMNLEHIQYEFDLLNQEKSVVIAEAYKEFVKRFKKKIKNVNFTIGQTWEIQCALKQTAKELSEVSDNA